MLLVLVRCIPGYLGNYRREATLGLSNTTALQWRVMMHRLLFAVVAVVSLFSLSVAAQSPNWTQVGSLMCKVDPNVGFIFAGHQPMQCTYTPSLTPAPPEYYDGAINTVGIDIGVSAGSVLAWGVFAPTTGLPQGALSGEYVGASGDVGFVVGGGPTCLSAAQGAPLPCNRCPCKARSHSMSCSESRPLSCVRRLGGDPMRASTLQCPVLTHSGHERLRISA
jgi:hypothetical protein